jgi:hypothetical protein
MGKKNSTPHRVKDTEAKPFDGGALTARRTRDRRRGRLRRQCVFSSALRASCDGKGRSRERGGGESTAVVCVPTASGAPAGAVGAVSSLSRHGQETQTGAK